MNQISFQNFRKFQELKPLELGEVTLLVGANNAGKSTLVKGLLLMLDNLRTLRVGGNDPFMLQRPEFRFDANVYHDLGIGTFGRALYNHPTRDEIGFTLRLSSSYNTEDQSGNLVKRNTDFTITIYVTGDKSSDQTTGNVSRILVSDHVRGIRFDFNYSAQRTVIEFDTQKPKASSMRKKLLSIRRVLEHELADLNNESQQLKKQIADKQKIIRERATLANRLNEEEMMVSSQIMEIEDKLGTIPVEDFARISDLTHRKSLLEDKARDLTEQRKQAYDPRMRDELAQLNSRSNSIILKIAERNAELDKLQKSLEVVSNEETEQDKPMRIEFGINSFMERSGINTIVNEIESVISYSSMSMSLSDTDKEDPDKVEEWQNTESDKAFIYERSSTLKELANDLADTISGISAEYISAHSATQNIFFNTADKNDYLAKVIHSYYREKIVPGSAAHNFIKTWMKKFGIGDDFEIQSLGGEAYRFFILDGNDKMDLADKGMGSNQLMILLISLATMIRKYERSQSKPFVVIEEPEQNLHPALQSRLIELLTEVNRQYGFHFIIETHSEYIVRKAQVLVAQGKYKDDKDAMSNSPYAVYYFPKEGEPYQMQFRKNGKFSNEFGAGFFDEAANLAFEIF